MLATLIVRILGAAATFGMGVFLARVLGPDGYGSYVFIVSLSLFVATIGQAGSGMALVKLRLQKETLPPAETRGLYAWHVLLSLGGACVLGILAAQAPVRSHDFGMPEILLTVLAALAGLLVTNTYQSVKRSTLAVLPTTLLVPCMIVLVTWMLALTTPGAVLAIYIAASIGFLAVFAVLFLGRLGNLPAGRDITIQWMGWSRFSIQFLIAQLGHALLFILLPAAYGFMADPADMGQFSVAYRLAATSLILFNAISVYATPHFADGGLVQDADRLRRLLIRVIGVSMLASLPIFIVLAGFPETLTGLLYGAEYVQAAAILPIAALGICFHATTGPLGNFLLMNGGSGFYNIISIAAGVAGVGTLVLFSADAGPGFAAWVMAITLIVWKSLIIGRALILYQSLIRTP